MRRAFFCGNVRRELLSAGIFRNADMKKGRPFGDGLFSCRAALAGDDYFFRKLAKGEMARRLLTMPGITSMTRSISSCVL